MPKITDLSRDRVLCPASRRGTTSDWDEVVPRHNIQTVAIGVKGEPTEPGKRSGGAVRKNEDRFALRKNAASSA